MNENLQKRIERVTEVKFSGYFIGNNKIKPSLDRTAAITKFPLPKTKKELQRFLGLLNYDRMFLKNVTKDTRPFYKLLEGRKKFK
jgi:hypothetical protein